MDTATPRQRNYSRVHRGTHILNRRKSLNRKTETQNRFITGDVIISDRIDYNKLIIGKEYTFKGVLVDRMTKKEILIDGKPVTVEKTITADRKTGYVYLEFKFNGSGLKKDDIIIHEVVERDGIEIANMVQDVPVIFDM